MEIIFVHKTKYATNPAATSPIITTTKPTIATTDSDLILLRR
jgi:hypothetical protein